MTWMIRAGQTLKLTMARESWYRRTGAMFRYRSCASPGSSSQRWFYVHDGRAVEQPRRCINLISNEVRL